jgi:hypothetical protein
MFGAIPLIGKKRAAVLGYTNLFLRRERTSAEQGSPACDWLKGKN